MAQLPKYKEKDFIVVTGACEDRLIGQTVQIVSVHEDDYIIDLLLPDTIYKPWSFKSCHENSYLNTTMTVLYAKK